MPGSLPTRAGVLIAGGAATAIAAGLGLLVIALVGTGCAETETPDRSSCDSTATRALVVAAVATCVACPLVGTLWGFAVARWRPLIVGAVAGLAAAVLLIGMIL